MKSIEIGDITVEVKLCPFCGNEAMIESYYGTNGLKNITTPPGIAMKCMNCGAQTKIVSLIIEHKYDKYESAIEAISLWNLRTS